MRRYGSLIIINPSDVTQFQKKSTPNLYGRCSMYQHSVNRCEMTHLLCIGLLELGLKFTAYQWTEEVHFLAHLNYEAHFYTKTCV